MFLLSTVALVCLCPWSCSNSIALDHPSSSLFIMNGSWFLHPLTPSLSASLPPITLRHAIGPHTHSAHTQHTHRAHTHNTAHTPITLRHAFGPHTPITRTDHEHQSRTPRTQTPIAHSTHTRAPPYIHTYTHKHTHTHTHTMRTTHTQK